LIEWLQQTGPSPQSLKANKNQKRKNIMPLVNVKLIENVFTPAQKKEMIEKITNTMVSIEGETMRGVTWVTVEEVKSGDWGICGQCLTTEAVHELQRGEPATV
jgi:4-oxalocrotonate tautomerase